MDAIVRATAATCCNAVAVSKFLTIWHISHNHDAKFGPLFFYFSSIVHLGFH
uniref:Uncharacterized protein n=1 Tax=Arundo donax TaxID=35708 RepID=A0A0A9BVR2_ARUDO